VAAGEHTSDGALDLGALADDRGGGGLDQAFGDARGGRQRGRPLLDAPHLAHDSQPMRVPPATRPAVTLRRLSTSADLVDRLGENGDDAVDVVIVDHQRWGDQYGIGDRRARAGRVDPHVASERGADHVGR